MVSETELDLGEEEAEGLLSFVAGAGIGLLVGAALATAFAPQPGEVTRAKLGEALSGLRGCLRRGRAEPECES